MPLLQGLASVMLFRNLGKAIFASTIWIRGAQAPRSGRAYT